MARGLGADQAKAMGFELSDKPINEVNMKDLKLVLHWENYFDLCDILVKNLKNHNFTDIIGIARGGLLPAQYLGYKLKVKRVHSFGISSYSGDNKRLSDSDVVIYQNTSAEFNKDSKILIVDDIADSGRTLQSCKYIQDLSCAGVVNTATLLYKPESSMVCPDFFAQVVDAKVWVIFPYDT